MFKYIPNILTIIRLLLIPFIVCNIFTGNYILAFIIFTISGITDIADGYIARKFNLVSNIGKLLDPFADKVTQISVLTSLFIKNFIPFWILLIVILKEFILIVSSSFLYGKNVVVYSRWYGKLSTCLLYLAIVTSLLLKQFNIEGFALQLDFILYCLALVTAIYSLIMYAVDLYKEGLIDKDDLNKEVTVFEKKKKKKQTQN